MVERYEKVYKNMKVAIKNKPGIWQRRAKLYSLPIVLATLVQGGVMFLLFQGFSLSKPPAEFELPKFMKAKVVVMPKKLAEVASAKATATPKPKETKKPKATAAPKPKEVKPKGDSGQQKVDAKANTQEQAQIAAAKVTKPPKPTKKPKPKPTKKPKPKVTPKPKVKPTPKPYVPQTDVNDILDLFSDPEPVSEPVNSAVQAADVDEDVGAYSDAIEEKIVFNWRFPVMYDPNSVVKVKVELLPSGELRNVSIVSPSGDPMLDRSVIDAVKNAAPFSVPSGATFEREFRSIILIFKPQDLM
jgi:periplasmic protein TonB